MIIIIILLMMIVITINSNYYNSNGYNWLTIMVVNDGYDGHDHSCES